MYSEKTVKDSIHYLYRGAIHEFGYPVDNVEKLLEKMDYHALASIFWRIARRVYAYETREKNSASPYYHGRDLFEQRAVMLYEDMIRCTADVVITGHAYEMWLKEDGNLVTVSCMTVNYERNKYETAFREIRGYPFGCGLKLNLERLTRELRELCGE